MGIKNAGDNYNLRSHADILKINSPRNRLTGPYCVVAINHVERWVIVALDWDRSPALGCRWFHNSNGNPISTGFATWFILPTALHSSILVNLDKDFKNLIEEFLSVESQSPKHIEISNILKETKYHELELFP